MDNPIILMSSCLVLLILVCILAFIDIKWQVEKVKRATRRKRSETAYQQAQARERIDRNDY